MAGREIAKFLSGFAASQMLTHGALAASGTEFTLLGIAYTPRFNALAALVWAIMTILLLYWAWIRG